MEIISITRSDVPTYLRSGEFYRSLSDEEDQDQQISIPSNTLKEDTTVNNNADLHHLLSSLRFWAVISIQEEVIKYCLSELELPSDDILQEFAQDFPYVSALTSVLSSTQKTRAITAVQTGLLEIVRNLPGNITVNVDCCRAAARAGNLEILQCLQDRGGVLNSSVLRAALEGGDKGLTCLQYLREQGVEWPNDPLVIALQAGSKECFHYAIQDGCTWQKYGFYSTLYGEKYVEALKYAIQYGFPVNKYSAEMTAATGAIRCLQVLHEMNCPWDEETCAKAARNGHLDCLVYLHENGCPWDEKTVYFAVYSNRVECVQYALQQGCPVTSDTSYFAAEKGYLSMLQVLHEHGVPWDEGICGVAAQFGHLDCLQYAHELGAPWDESTFRRTLERGQLECLKYLLENGCPIAVSECQELMAQGKCSQEAVDMVRFFYPHILP